MPSVPRLFADDTAVVVSADSLQNLEVFINLELSKINTWMNQNEVTINPLKSYALIIPPTLAMNPSSINVSLNSSRIEVTECINHLACKLIQNYFLTTT